MNEKDMAEKHLEACPDVFADISNVLLFQGERLIRPEELVPGTTVSQYKADGRAHEQSRDVSMIWTKEQVAIALLCFENQTRIDRDMVFRTFAYDGASYREQMTLDLPDRIRRRYPVLTLVLYFGDQPWKAPKKISEAVQIPEKLQKYVCDYQMNLVDVASLTQEQVDQFTSDFQIIADYFVNKDRPDFRFLEKKMDHADEVLQMMSAMTGDNRYQEAYNEGLGKEGGSMCQVLDRAEARGEARGEARRLKQLVELIERLAERQKVTIEVACDMLGEPYENYLDARKLLTEAVV